MFALMPTPYKIAGLIALLAMIPVAFGLGYWHGRSNGKVVEKVKVLEKIVEVEKENEINKKEIQRLNDDELISRYCASSVFDVPYDECVRTVTYVE